MEFHENALGMENSGLQRSAGSEEEFLLGRRNLREGEKIERFRKCYFINIPRSTRYCSSFIIIYYAYPVRSPG